MTATLSPEVSAAAPATTVGFENLLRSEWTKLRSLRSTYWSAAFVVLATVGLGIFMGARWAHQSGPIPPGFDSTNTSLSGVYLAQIIVGALGVLTITSEYATGMIRATFSAVPQRRTLLAAKAVVLAVATLVLAEAVCFVAFLSCQALLANKGVGVSLGDPGALRSVSGPASTSRPRPYWVSASARRSGTRLAVYRRSSVSCSPRVRSSTCCPLTGATT